MLTRMLDRGLWSTTSSSEDASILSGIKSNALAHQAFISLDVVVLIACVNSYKSTTIQGRIYLFDANMLLEAM